MEPLQNDSPDPRYTSPWIVQAERWRAAGAAVELFTGNATSSAHGLVAFVDRELGAVYVDLRDPQDTTSGSQIWVLLSAVVAFRILKEKS